MIKEFLSKCASLLYSALSIGSNSDPIYNEELSKEVTKHFFSCDISVYIINSSESRVYAFPNNIVTISPFLLKLRSIFAIGPIFIGLLSLLESLYTQNRNSYGDVQVRNKGKTYQKAGFSPINISGMPRLLKDNTISTTRIGAITLFITDTAYNTLTKDEQIAMLLYSALLDVFWIKKASLGLMNSALFAIFFHRVFLLYDIHINGKFINGKYVKPHTESHFNYMGIIPFILAIICVMLISHKLSGDRGYEEYKPEAYFLAQQLDMGEYLESALEKCSTGISHFQRIQFSDSTINKLTSQAELLANSTQSIV